MIRGEMADRLPYVPRLDLWHNANALSGTLPERHRGKGSDQICRADGSRMPAPSETSPRRPKG